MGITAALAAAAGVISLGHSALGEQGKATAAVDAATSTVSARGGDFSTLATARIARRERESRDLARVRLGAAVDPKAGEPKQQAASRLAAARAAKLDGYRLQTQRRAAALSAAKRAADRAEAEARAAARKAVLPVAGYRITATFGQGGSRWARNHTGTDFAAAPGTRIGAVMKGTVIAAGWAGAYGKQVKIRHNDGTESWYNHMSEIEVSVGDAVNAGDRIGAVGSTGNSTGPHLHLEIRPGGGEPVNPIPWLRNHDLDP
ncbi:M23 family metallopeptidase [Kribbella sp. DT2]|uniref:M23 family metallopeptidase n=1 Tax=Kribbella sp. DT2 TaxID=3393427 RepID=UPI003CF9E811